MSVTRSGSLSRERVAELRAAARDPRLRLAVADRFTEQGDVRGEYGALGLLLAAQAPAARSPALERRREALEEPAARRWFTEVHGALQRLRPLGAAWVSLRSDVPSLAAFERGELREALPTFERDLPIDGLSIRGDLVELTLLRAAPLLAMLRSLEVGDPYTGVEPVDELVELLALPQARGLERLDVRLSAAPARLARAWACADGLKSLGLTCAGSQNPFFVAELLGGQVFPALEELQLAMGRLSADALRRCAEATPGLRSLTLYGVELTGGPFSLPEGAWPRLEGLHLHVRNESVQPLVEHALRGAFPGLRQLTIAAQGTVDVTGLAALPLTELNLSSAERARLPRLEGSVLGRTVETYRLPRAVDDGVITELARSPLPALTRLHAAAVPVERLQDAPWLGHLRELTLQGGPAAEPLLLGRAWPRMESLALYARDGWSRPEAVASWLDAERAPNLRSLSPVVPGALCVQALLERRSAPWEDLDWAGPTRAALRALAEAPMAESVRTLKLRAGEDLDAADVKALATGAGLLGLRVLRHSTPVQQRLIDRYWPRRLASRQLQIPGDGSPGGS
ncbi:MAG: hypothetical protein K1X89_11705 [Myxococcaceae bacterium]|nr:hypothetical protein [Myxococcaceae bacterium]